MIGMIPSSRNRVFDRAAAALLVLAVLAPPAQQVRYAFALGEALSPIADPFAEADTIRSAEAYAAEGLASQAGLPQVTFGRRFPGEGTQPGPDASAIYLHYPPLPNWIAGLVVRAVGGVRVPLMRLAPIAVGFACLGALATALARAEGRLRAAAILGALEVAPLFSNMMHGLHHEGYALALLLAELGVLVRAFAPPREGVPPPRGTLAWLAAIGFLEGWLSFDFCFLVAFAALPIWLLSPDPLAPPARRRAALCVLVPGAAFTAAHALHFLQVAIHLGGLGAALDDYLRIAVRRAAGTLDGRPVPPPALLSLLRRYVFELLPSPRFLGTAGSGVAAVAVLALLAGNIRVRLGGDGLAFRAPRRRLLAAAAAFAIASLWLAVMRQHAAVHAHYVPRHWVLFYFVVVLGVARGFAPAGATERRPWEGGEESAPRSSARACE